MADNDDGLTLQQMLDTLPSKAFRNNHFADYLKVLSALTTMKTPNAIICKWLGKINPSIKAQLKGARKYTFKKPMDFISKCHFKYSAKSPSKHGPNQHAENDPSRCYQQATTAHSGHGHTSHYEHGNTSHCENGPRTQVKLAPPMTACQATQTEALSYADCMLMAQKAVDDDAFAAILCRWDDLP